MMNLYNPIITKGTKEHFLDYVSSIDLPQIDYFAIGIQDINKKRSISLMSNEEWQKLFYQNNFSLADPVRRITLLTKRNIIPFSEIDHIDSIGKEIMRQRSLCGIKNGIIFMQRHEKYNHMITLGTSFSHFNAYDFLKRYYAELARFKQELTKIIAKETALFMQMEK